MVGEEWYREGWRKEVMETKNGRKKGCPPEGIPVYGNNYDIMTLRGPIASHHWPAVTHFLIMLPLKQMPFVTGNTPHQHLQPPFPIHPLYLCPNYKLLSTSEEEIRFIN